MSMITELFGEGIINIPLEQVKKYIKELPPTIREKRSYLLKDFAAITGITLTTQDFIDIGG